MALKRCALCSKPKIVAEILSVCRDCLLERFSEALPHLRKAHRETREAFLLPLDSSSEESSSEESYIRCNLCARGCRLSEGSTGFCGLRKAQKGAIKGSTNKEALVSWYLDPLPTNCVADWICPGGTGCGFPTFSYRTGPEYGYFNLAVFFEACNLNCLYCQNWHYRYSYRRMKWVNVEALLECLNPQISCICYFGGDPSPQTPFAIKFSEEALKRKKGPILRICWETNGLFSPHLLPKIIELSLISGGIIKFDLKAWHKEIHFALTGYENDKILQNFRYVSQFIRERKEIPLLTASTLLVPGYVEEEEVYQIAQFIAQIDPEIPYRLLAFSPQFYMKDLPFLDKEKALKALRAAKKAGLKRVSLGNEHLLR